MSDLSDNFLSQLVRALNSIHIKQYFQLASSSSLPSQPPCLTNYVESILMVGPWIWFFKYLSNVIANSNSHMFIVRASVHHCIVTQSPRFHYHAANETHGQTWTYFPQHDHCNITCHTMEMQWKQDWLALEKDINVVNGQYMSFIPISHVHLQAWPERERGRLD